MKKLTFILFVMLALVGMKANAQMYIVGNVPFGDWNPGGGVEMTDNGDGTYTYVTDQISGTVYFVFGDGQDSNWTNFNQNYRYGPLQSNQQVKIDTEYTTQKSTNGDVSYYFAGTAGQAYTITFDTNTSTFKIEGYVEPFDPLTGQLFVLGNVNGNNWNPSTGIEMTTTDENVFTLTDAEITDGGDGYGYFSFTSKLGEHANDWSITAYRRGAEVDRTLVEDGVPAVLADWGTDGAFMIAPGLYDIEVNLSDNTVMLIKKGDTPGPEPYDGDVYILGEVNDNGGWFTNKGVLMTRDVENALYTATITTAGENFPEDSEIGYSYFSFTKQLADSAADWDAIAPYRFGALSSGDYMVTDEVLGTEIPLQNNGQAFCVPAGTWELTLSVNEMTLVINKVTFEIGDVNHSGGVDIADVTALISIVLKKSGYPAEADCNGDNEVNIADVTMLIGRVLSGSW